MSSGRSCEQSVAELGDPAGAAVALELARLEREVRGLTMALVSNRAISLAIGLMMERHGLDREAAHARVVQLSQNSNTKLALVAERIVQAAEERTSA